jgi:carbonic anhydrase
MSTTDELLTNAEGCKDDVGIKPDRVAAAFADLDEDVRQSVSRTKTSQFSPRKDTLRGFVYEVHAADLHEVQVSD